MNKICKESASKSNQNNIFQTLNNEKLKHKDEIHKTK